MPRPEHINAGCEASLHTSHTSRRAISTRSVKHFKKRYIWSHQTYISLNQKWWKDLFFCVDLFLRVVGGLGGFFAWLRTALAGRKRMRVECSPKGRCRGRKDAAPTAGEHQPSNVVRGLPRTNHAKNPLAMFI